MPPHAYIPGRTARHTEDWFDEIKSSVHPGIEPEDLCYTQAFKAGLFYLDAGYFWECHEVLEAVWMQTPLGSHEREMVQALIQLANARLKVVMARPRAARRLCSMVEDHLSRCPDGVPILGLLPEVVRGWIATVRVQL